MSQLGRVTIAVLTVLLVASCGKSEVSGNTDLREEHPTAPRASDDFFMVPAYAPNFTVNVTEQSPVEVFLYSKQTGEPADGQNISYEIIEAGGGASLSALQTQTAGGGLAAVDLRAGATQTQVVVRADHPSSNAVDFTIDIMPLEVGGLRVTPVNTAPSIMDLMETDIRVYREGEFRCDDFRPLFGQPEALVTVQSPHAGEPAQIDDLGTSEIFVLTAVARGDRGQIAAAGCMDGVITQADTVRDIDLLLQLIPLNPVGTYDVVSNWDFTDAIADSGTVGSIIVRVLDLFENPGRAIYNEAINLVEAFVGGIISGGIDAFLSATGLDDEFEQLINDFIASNEVLTQLFQAGSDIRDIIANLEVHSQLTIGKLNSDYEFRGSDNWTGITLYWRWDCEVNAPADCGAIPLDVEPSGEIGSLGVLSSEWTGRVVAYDTLQVDTHTVSLRYGRLIIYVLNEIVLPELTDGNAHSMSEAFAHWIGCEDIAVGVTGDDEEICAFDACLYADQIEGFCDTAVATVFGFADLVVQSLEFDMGLHLGGEGRLFENDSDGLVDLIDEGMYEGYIRSSDQSAPSSPFFATWTATKRNLDTDNIPAPE